MDILSGLYIDRSYLSELLDEPSICIQMTLWNIMCHFHFAVL
uniref:Uncharacterized protein n=1 Tax=Anguilla anguilla TaxID=7936 RepID=A0A0E9WEH3_ANGAN